MAIVRYAHAQHFQNNDDIPARAFFENSGGSMQITVPAPQERFTGHNAFLCESGAWGEFGNFGNEATMYIGASFYEGTTDNPYTNPFFTFFDSTTIQLTLYKNAAGELIVYRGDSGGTELGRSATGVIGFNQWRRITMRATINSTTGVVEVWVGNTKVINLTGQNTQASANAFTNLVRVQTPASDFNTPTYFTDVVLNDTNGSYNTGFLGDLSIETLKPTADAAAAWTPSTGVDNYAMVDEDQNDADSTYVETSVTSTRDNYTMGNITGSFTNILAVGVFSFARKTDGTTRSIRNVARGSSLTLESNTDTELNASYEPQVHIAEQDPDTASAWSVAGVNAMGVGIEAQ